MTRQLVIIPLYNESSTIADVLRELRCRYQGDVLVVNDGSTDASAVSVATVNDPRVNVLTHATNKGYGASLIDGFSYAVEREYEYVVTMDCDFQHEPCQVAEFFEKICAVDVLSGSRYLKDMQGDVAAPADRRAINQQITELINHITGFGLTDTFCGFKAYRVAALKKLCLSETGYAFPLQFWMQAWKNGFTVKELAVARIYLPVKRSFGIALDDPKERLRYYLEVIERERTRCRPT